MNELASKTKIISLLKELNKFTHGGTQISNEIKVEYYYINKKYDSIYYRVNNQSKIILYNLDFDSIYVINSEKDVFKALNDLQTNKFY